MDRQLYRILAILCVLVAGCSQRATPQELEALSDIETVDQLASDFNEDVGSPRLLLLLSPT